jgi:hypothetical protein
MTRQEVLDRLAAHEADLHAKGVASLDLFGSLAREEASEHSDVDLLVEFDHPVGLFEFFEVQRYIEDLLGTDKIDLVLRRSVFEEIQDGIYAEAVSCF